MLQFGKSQHLICLDFQKSITHLPNGANPVIKFGMFYKDSQVPGVTHE